MEYIIMVAGENLTNIAIYAFVAILILLNIFLFTKIVGNISRK